MQIGAPLAFWLGLFHFERMRLHIGIIPAGGNLPGHLSSGLTAANFEFIVGNLLDDMEIGRGTANCGQLIAEILI